LRATYSHPLSPRWAGDGGGNDGGDAAWTTETLDDVVRPDDGLEPRVASIAGGLAAAGVEPGAVVSWQLPNGLDAIALFRACWRLGAVAAPIHHLAGPADVAALRGRLGSAVHVDDADAVPAGPPVPRSLGGEPAPAPVDPASLALALGTSGSTGTPKIALHSHRALVYKTRLMTRVHRLGPADCVLMPAPMAHVSGLQNGVLLAASGMRVVPMAKWDPAEALALIERERVTFMIGPPAFFVSLMDAPGFTPAAVGSLRQISCGGAGVTPAFVREASAVLGCRVKRTYGSTEAPTVTTSTLDDPAELAATTDGRPVGLVEVRTSPAGELLVRGPELFVGYDDPVATAAAFTDDGWFRTGDLADIDAGGWITIVGRIRDVIIRGGENIAPAEVEAVLEAHPAVRQAAVIGYPDRRLGERACAFVVLDAGGPFDLAACRAWCDRQGLTRFKWPERVEVLDALPLLPAGKPDRSALAARLAG
jgi:cyclohexanecarboxylate-CoA ligase